MSSVPENMLTSPSLDVDARVSEKTRGKIWNNEYIDIRCFLNNPINENRYQLTFKSAQGTFAPANYLEPVAKPKQVFTIE